MSRITVTVDGRPYELVAGSEVWQLVELLPPELQLAIQNGLAYLTDRFGNQLGSGGALFDGQMLAVMYVA